MHPHTRTTSPVFTVLALGDHDQRGSQRACPVILPNHHHAHEMTDHGKSSVFEFPAFGGATRSCSENTSVDAFESPHVHEMTDHRENHRTRTFKSFQPKDAEAARKVRDRKKAERRKRGGKGPGAGGAGTRNHR